LAGGEVAALLVTVVSVSVVDIFLTGGLVVVLDSGLNF